MRVIVQRVKRARIAVESRLVAEIGKGVLLFVGIAKEDQNSDIEYMAKKIVNLRIFEDKEGKMNLGLLPVEGELLSVPQFTLYADIKKGNRPGFDDSADLKLAKEFWMKFNQRLKEQVAVVKEGVFGAHMEVELVNDGPVTIWLDSRA